MRYRLRTLLTSALHCKRLALQGGVVAIACSVVIMICAPLSFVETGLRLWIGAIDRLATIGFVVASIAAAVGGTGIVLDAAFRRRT